MGIVVLFYSQVKIGASKQKNLTTYCNSGIIGVRKQRNDRMTIDELPDIVYHGTISIHKDSLISGIDITKGYHSTDFGQGFYTTSNYEQAKALSIDKTNIYNARHLKSADADPMIIKYSLDKAILKKYRGLIFDDPNEKWKEFIYNNRVGGDFLISEYYNKNGKFHYVYGCVADSKITDMTKEIRKNIIDYGEYFDRLKPLKKNEYNQLSFHSNEIVKALNVISIEFLEGKVLLV